MHGLFIKEQMAAKQSKAGKNILLEDYTDVAWRPCGSHACLQQINGQHYDVQLVKNQRSIRDQEEALSGWGLLPS